MYGCLYACRYFFTPSDDEVVFPRHKMRFTTTCSPYGVSKCPSCSVNVRYLIHGSYRLPANRNQGLTGVVHVVVRVMMSDRPRLGGGGKEQKAEKTER